MFNGNSDAIAIADVKQKAEEEKERRARLRSRQHSSSNVSSRQPGARQKVSSSLLRPTQSAQLRTMKLGSKGQTMTTEEIYYQQVHEQPSTLF